MKKTISSVIWEYLKSFLLAVIIALIIRTYLFQITEVYGQSMYPTLHDHDRLFTNRIIYTIAKPDRGDIVILDAPDRPGTFYVKRAIALAGDRLKITGGIVYVNGEKQDEPYINGNFTEGDIDTVVPPGTVFVMGDNRGNSHDSRSPDVSYIPVDDIEGKAVFRIWPFDKFGKVN
ncbi:signal peptidase I [Candidatus Formimonas warabiya]|uniref:Signal peptidase I n=1 Tax=Formimonas warabiya TaxID=1761012 RepID=A0A3G1KUY2_FORW1|nr:signal peptidase I [Candidatus Formimonas warabiya]ATW26244.1 signal peptidase I [Candidatus Formimonas warabiya]